MNFTSSRILITTLLLIFSLGITAQNATDSVKRYSKEYSASYLKSKKSIFSTDPLRSKFDTHKLASISYEQLTGSDYELKSGGKKYESGELNAIRRFNANIGYIPILSKEKFTLSGSLRYRYELTPYNIYGLSPWEHDLDVETHYFVGGLTFEYRNKLFGRDVNVRLKALTDGSKEGFESVLGSAAISYNVYKTSNTVAAIGVYGTTSRAVIFPIFPTITYKHRFGESQWLVDFNLPYHAYLRRMIGNNGRLSAGMTLGGSMAYIYPNALSRQAGMSKTYSYRRLDIKGEVKYEHFIAKNLLVNVDLGLVKAYKGVFRKKNDSDDFIKLTQDPNVFFSFGVSYTMGFF